MKISDLTFNVASDVYEAGRMEDGQPYTAELYYVMAEDGVGIVGVTLPISVVALSLVILKVLLTLKIYELMPVVALPLSLTKSSQMVASWI